MAHKFHVYKDDQGKWRWRLKARNGKIIADSGEGYNSERNIRDAVSRLADQAKAAQIVNDEA